MSSEVSHDGANGSEKVAPLDLERQSDVPHVQYEAPKSLGAGVSYLYIE